MSKVTMNEMLTAVRKQGYAVGAFNIFNYVSARAVITAAEKQNKPVILQTSVGTVKYYGVKETAGMVKDLITHAKVPVYLHLDHCTEADFAKECVDAGWDAVMIDASQYSLAENIRITKEVVDYAHAQKVVVEGELGVIEGVEEEIQAASGKLADYQECLQYVTASGVDIFAPALGTAHGVYKGTPRIDFNLARQLGGGLGQPLVCHGGSGLSPETFRRLITDGISKVNISTALKHAYLGTARQYLDTNPDVSAPLKLEAAMFAALEATAAEHIQIFGNGK